MTRLVWLRSGGAVKLKRVRVVRRVLGGVGVVKLQPVRVICPACGQQVEAVARDGRVKGYCAVAGRSVDFLAERQGVGIREHPMAETKGRDTSGRFLKGYVPWNKRRA